MEEKQRMIQEYVPGKQVTLAHIIANPDQDIYVKLGLNTLAASQKGALGIMTITPSEASIIAADIATKSAGIKIGFLDRFSGSVVITGNISAVESAIEAILKGLKEILGFTIDTKITKT
jgi:ethanolamine utilization protein EutS